MNPVDRIREQRRLNTLQNLVVRPHRKRIVHLDNVRSIGIIAHNLSDTEQAVLGRFADTMTGRGTIVRKIELPAMADSLLDRMGFPKADFTRLFTTYQYDVLIDATPTGDTFGLFLTLTAASSLRVGYLDTDLPADRLYTDAYDLILRGKGPGNLQKYLSDIIKFLSQIRK